MGKEIYEPNYYWPNEKPVFNSEQFWGNKFRSAN